MDVQPVASRAESAPVPRDSAPLPQPSPPAPQPSALAYILQRANSVVGVNISIDHPGFVAVVAIERWLLESQGKPGGRCPPAPWYCYDVTLTDRDSQIKCHLAAELNYLVQKNILRPGREIQIQQCSIRYDEKRLGAKGLYIQKVELGEDFSCLLRDMASSGFPPLEVYLKDTQDFYLPLWNSEDPFGEMWNEEVQSEFNGNVSKVISLSTLNMMHNVWNWPPLLVRIMFKSRLHYFGKPEKRLAMPYQVYLEVADHSGTMSVILWDCLCSKWYQTLHVGTVVMLQEYVVKPSFKWRTKPVFADSGIRKFTSLDINLNPCDPTACITVIPEDAVKPEWRLPQIKYRFITRAELDHLPHTTTCDVIGYVTFVGRSERLRKRKEGEDFWVYRWVHAVDGTTEEPIVLEIFATSQPEVFNRIHPLTYIVCTQMRVMKANPETAPFKSYLTTSNESQIFITGQHRGQPYSAHPRVMAFAQWMNSTYTGKESDCLQRCVIGGHYSYPPIPPTLSLYWKLGATSFGDKELTVTNELMKEMNNLHYRERRRVAVQGIIMAVRYVSLSHAPEDATNVELMEEGSLEPSVFQNTRSMEKNKRCFTEEQLQQANSQLLQDEETPSLLGSADPQMMSPPPPAKTPGLNQRVQYPRASKKKIFTEALQTSAVPIASTSAGTQSDCYWESEMWGRVKENVLEHLRFGQLPAETIPRRPDRSKTGFLARCYNLHPSRFNAADWECEKEIHELTPAIKHGYFIVTILGLNQETAIDVPFIPVVAPEDHRAVGVSMDAHDNTFCSCLTSGYVRQQRDRDGMETSRTPLDEMVESAAVLDGQCVVCILDLCHLGGDSIEVILLRAYNVTNAS
uniref:RPA1 related single stranded DNA binding protein, X-linked n=1 Tax=Latimeria chalumnae TaxID=7897 RepID=H3ARP8_LATCH